MVTPLVVHGNALDLAACGIADGSVDLIVTSPPYFGLRSYQDGGEHYAGQIGAEATPAEFVDALVAATAEMVRVLKPSGSIFVNLGDKYATSGTRQGNRGNTDGLSVRETAKHYMGTPKGYRDKSLMGMPWRYALRCIDDLGLILRAEIVWSKPNGLPESVTDRVRRSHETWFHFTKAPRYYANVDEVREPHLAPTRTAGMNAMQARNASAPRTAVGGYSGPNPLGKLPGSVWSIPTQPLRLPEHLGVQHFAAFPMEWPRRFIKAWCPPDGVVLDPFGGTGTTATVAHALGRHGITVDLSHDYCRVAQWRTTDPGQLAKARQAPKPRPVVVTTGEGDVEVPPGEPTLLDLIEGDAA